MRAMHIPIQSVHIITKSGHSEAKRLGGVIQEWLVSQGCDACIVPSENFTRFDAREPTLPDAVLVLGGDGTLLRVAGGVSELGIPLIGINFGRVGFLTALSPEDWKPLLQAVLRGAYRLSPRILLGYDLWREETIIEQGRFVNDLVVGRSGLARLVRLSLWQGSTFISTFRADGLIVATPVGSTAYAAAAGGALISPELEVMEICPVCPFMSDFMPLIVPSQEEITIRVESSSP